MQYRTLIFLLLLTSVTQILAQDKYSKVKINYQSYENFERLIQIGIPMDHGKHDANKGIFTSVFSSREITQMQELGISYEILIEDMSLNFLQKNAEAANKIKTKIDKTNETYPTPSNFELGSMGGYLTYQEMLDNLDAMHQLYPELISARANVGDFLTNGEPNNSVSPSIGGNALQWVKISDNPNDDEDEPEILYDAIHHAREPASLSQLIYFMWYLLENYETDDTIKEIVNTTELYFIPVVNPDGYLYNQFTNPNGGGYWRKNRYNGHGVDNNRNYDHYPNGTAASSIWATSGTSANTNSDTYPGTGPFSEVENQAMRWFTEQHNFVIALNNHTSGDLLLYPYGYARNTVTEDDAIYKIISDEMVSENGFDNIVSAGLYPAAGDSDDYMYGGTTRPHNKIYAFTPEIGSSFWPVSSAIDGICKSMMYLNLSAAKITHNYAKTTNLLDEVINNTYTFDATYQIQRLGVGGDGTFTVRIIPISDNIEVVESPNTHNNMDIGDTVSDKIRITLKTDSNNNAPISYWLETDGGTYKDRVKVNTSVVLSTTENRTNSYAIAPNPTKDFISIAVEQPLKTKVRLINIEGKQLKNHTFDTTNTTIDCTQYPTGIYFLQLENNKVTETIKIIKQ